MKFKDYCKNINEEDMKFQALGMAKDVQKAISNISFIEMLSVMSPDNPAKKEVQDLESKISNLSNEINDFIQKYIPDVADSEDKPKDKEAQASKELKAKEKENKPFKKAAKSIQHDTADTVSPKGGKGMDESKSLSFSEFLAGEK